MTRIFYFYIKNLHKSVATIKIEQIKTISKFVLHGKTSINYRLDKYLDFEGLKRKTNYEFSNVNYSFGFLQRGQTEFKSLCHVISFNV